MHASDLRNNPTMYSSTYSPLTTLALRKIEEKTGHSFADWNGPEIRSDDTDYKIDWSPPDAESDAILTLYSDGTWSYEKTGEGADGRFPPPHSLRWVSMLTERETLGVVALHAVLFFQDLKKSLRRRRR
jgi:hypothetical protein